MNSRTSLLGFAVMAVFACGKEPLRPGATVVPPGEPIPFDNVASATLTAVKTPTYTLILDQDEWTRAWTAISAGQLWPPAPPPPAIDFGTQMLVLAGAGELPTQLVSFRIEDVRLDNGVLRVTVHQDWPAPRCGSLPVITSPVHVITIPRVATTAEFTTKKTDSC